MTPAQKSEIDVQVVSQGCIAVCDELPGVKPRDIAGGMLLAAAATVAGANILLSNAERGVYMSRLARALNLALDTEIGTPKGANAS